MKRVIFDNGGGITVQLGDWAHCYQDPMQAADDVRNYIDAQSTDGWEGHEEEAMTLDPSQDDIRNGGYRIWHLDEKDVDLCDGWNNAYEFFDALNVNQRTNVKTKIWLTGKDEEAVVVDRGVTDLDEAARLLGFDDYVQLRCKSENVDSAEKLSEEDEYLNFKYMSLE